MTKLSPDSPFSKAMKEGRSQFNKRIADVQKQNMGFDIQALSSWLSGPAAFLAESLPRYSTEIASVCLDTSIMLVVHGLTSQQGYSPFKDLWMKILPQCSYMLSSYPRQTLGILHNCALNMHSYNGDFLSRWIDRISILVDRVRTVPELRALCALLAWKSGLAHYRISALRAAESLSEELALLALGVPEGRDLKEAISRFMENRWFNPEIIEQESLRVVHEIGAFTGFNGKFPCPPTVRACNDGFAVRSGDQYFWLFADAFGALIHGGLKKEYYHELDRGNDDNNPGKSIQKGVLFVGNNKLNINLPEDGLSQVNTADSIAVFSPWSYSIILISLPGSFQK